MSRSQPYPDQELEDFSNALLRAFASCGITEVKKTRAGLEIMAKSPASVSSNLADPELFHHEASRDLFARMLQSTNVIVLQAT
jgi:hypothetical protein